MNRTLMRSPSPIVIASIGVILVTGSLLCYQYVFASWIIVSTSSIDTLEVAAYATIVLLLVGLSLALLGFTRYVLRPSSSEVFSPIKSFVSGISMMISNRRSLWAFAIGSISYGFLFAIASSTIVFQPASAFAETYGARVPSIVPVLCCGSLGQLPQIVIYATQQAALLIVPLNLILLFMVSWLVGLNAAVAAFAYGNRLMIASSKWIGGFGAFIGLFTGCPTCAGLFLLTIVGLGGAATSSLALTPLQPIFICATIPVLFAAPILAGRAFKNQTCNSGN